jgi:membrane protein
MTKQPINLFKLKPVRYIFRKAHGIIVPGLDGASLFEAVRFLFKEIKTLQLQERAAAVTYNFLMALPPTFLFLFSLVPYLPLKNVEQTVLNTIKLLAPNRNIYNNVQSVVTDFMTKQHKDVLSYGIILVLFFSSNGIMGFMRSFDKSLSLYVKRTGLQRRWTAMKLTVVLIGINIVALTVLIYQSKDLNPYILKIFHSILAVKIVSGIILALLVFVSISTIYTFAPSLKRKFNFVSTGSIFATIAIVIVTSVFFFLVNNFINYNKIYGSIGTLIAFMVWVWLNSIIILLGYELNVSKLLGKISMEEQHEKE